MWSEAINVFKGYSRIDEEVNKIIQTATLVRGKVVVDMIHEELVEHIEGHQKVVDEQGVGRSSQVIYRRIN